MGLFAVPRATVGRAQSFDDPEKPRQILRLSFHALRATICRKNPDGKANQTDETGLPDADGGDGVLLCARHGIDPVSDG